MIDQHTQRTTEPAFGLCQWFHYLDYERLEQAAARLKELGVTHLRTGISWADYHRPDGPAWYDWQMARLADLKLLVSIWHTPPSIAEDGKCAAPPQRLEDYGEFIGECIDRYGPQIEAIELWNEPNNRYKWDFVRYDPEWSKFATMIRHAARQARARHMMTALGGMSPVDHRWLARMGEAGALDDIDVIGIHGFPGMWWDGDICWEQKRAWQGWAAKVNYIRAYAEDRPIWVTETGLATWQLEEGRAGRFDEQADRLVEAAAAPAERVYWYSLFDLPPEREAIEGFHVDENEYHMGLLTTDGRAKPAYARLNKLMAQHSAHARGALAPGADHRRVRVGQ